MANAQTEYKRKWVEKNRKAWNEYQRQKQAEYREKRRKEVEKLKEEVLMLTQKLAEYEKESNK